MWASQTSADLVTCHAQGRSGAVSVIAMAEKGALFDPGPCMYMEKLAVGPSVNPHMVSLLYPIERNLKVMHAAFNTCRLLGNGLHALIASMGG